MKEVYEWFLSNLESKQDVQILCLDSEKTTCESTLRETLSPTVLDVVEVNEWEYLHDITAVELGHGVDVKFSDKKYNLLLTDIFDAEIVESFQRYSCGDTDVCVTQSYLCNDTTAVIDLIYYYSKNNEWLKLQQEDDYLDDIMIIRSRDRFKISKSFTKEEFIEEFKKTNDETVEDIFSRNAKDGYVTLNYYVCTALGKYRPEVDSIFNHHPGFEAALSTLLSKFLCIEDKEIVQKVNSVLPDVVKTSNRHMLKHCKKALDILGIPYTERQIEYEDEWDD